MKLNTNGYRQRLKIMVAYLEVANKYIVMLKSENDKRIGWMEKLRWNGNDGVKECPWCHHTPRTHVPCEFSKELGDEN